MNTMRWRNQKKEVTVNVDVSESNLKAKDFKEVINRLDHVEQELKRLFEMVDLKTTME